MAITAQLVKELREKTGAGMMDCKKALTKTDGNIDEAVKYLREQGIAAAAKRASKIAAEGIISIKQNDSRVCMMEVNSETDFVAKNEDFQKAVADINESLLNSGIDNLEDFMKYEENGTSIQTVVTNLIAKIGENIGIRRISILSSTENEVLGNYVHLGGKIGVIVKLSLSDASAKSNEKIQELVKDLCMQVTAAEPKYVDSDSVDNSDIEAEKDIYRQQMKNQGKPDKIIENIVNGKIRKYYEEICLIEQTFVKDTSKKIKDVLKELSKELNSEIKVMNFVRYKVGEGIEKKECNFADEIQAELEKNK